MHVREATTAFMVDIDKFEHARFTASLRDMNDMLSHVPQYEDQSEIVIVCARRFVSMILI